MKLKWILSVFLIFALNSVHASIIEKSIVCENPRINKKIVLTGHKVTFLNTEKLFKHQAEGRRLASIGRTFEYVRTQKTHSSLTKFVNFEGNKHTIHIENKNGFSYVNDYISIKSREGHELTYPLNCHYQHSI